ncbi:MAG: hypothetical protein KAS72_07670 [Phycisphaerales bacterium]|nr:hypothetical protein [Phycisphaerales bacterium]
MNSVVQTTRRPARWGLLALCATAAAWAGPKETIERRSADTARAVEPVSATYFGGSGIEQVAGAGFGEDRTIILFLNAWGPDIPQADDEDAMNTVLGWRFSTWNPDCPIRLKPEPGTQRWRLNHENPNITGVIVRYSPMMDEILSVSRFGFGVARFGPAGSCKVGPDGGLYISGRGRVPFVEIAPQARGRTLKDERADRITHYDRLCTERDELRRSGIALPPLPTGRERVAREIEEAQGRVVYLARLNPQATKVQWALMWDDISRAHNPAIDFHFDHEGFIVLRERNRLLRVSPDGRHVTTLPELLPDKLDAWTVDPHDGSRYAAGRTETETGRERFDTPFLDRTTLTGSLAWRAWGWSGLLVGLDRYRLVAPSWIEHIAPVTLGATVIVCRHEGSRTLFSRDVFDLDKPAQRDADPLIASVAQRRRGPASTLLVELDAATKAIRRMTYWASFVPDQRRPWGHRAGQATDLSITSITALPDGSTLLAGRSETGLPETPSAYVRIPNDEFYAGAYIAILDPRWRALRLGSYLPACENAHIVEHGGRVLVFGNALERDSLGNAPVLHHALQRDFAGETDAWIMLLDLSDTANAVQGDAP